MWFSFIHELYRTQKRTNTHSEGEPTSIANRDMYLTVYPCSCTRKAENDIKTLKEILKN